MYRTDCVCGWLCLRALCVCTSCMCRLCLVKRCVCGWLQAVFVRGVCVCVCKFVGLHMPSRCAGLQPVCKLRVCARVSFRVCKLCGCVQGLAWVSVCTQIRGLCLCALCVFVLRVCVCTLRGVCVQAVLVCVGLRVQVCGFAACSGGGFAHTNLQTVPPVCMCGGVAGCLHALCVCV